MRSRFCCRTAGATISATALVAGTAGARQPWVTSSVPSDTTIESSPRRSYRRITMSVAQQSAIVDGSTLWPRLHLLA